jgi:hypothetical protein
MSKEAYVPQSYPLFVALDRIELPGSIRELDIYDAKAAVRDAVNRRQLDIHRVMAWLITDEPDLDGIFARPITVPVRATHGRWQRRQMASGKPWKSAAWT